MTVWTISAQEGTPGDHVAAGLATAADVPLFDRERFAELADQLGIEIPILDQLEERFCGRGALALALASGVGVLEAALELKQRRELPEIGRRLIAEAARSSCVIPSPAAFVPLADHPGAIHARIHAPFEWRLNNYRREHLLDHHHAAKTLKHADHLQQAWVRLLYDTEINDNTHYTLSLDASRLPPDRLIDVLLAVAGHKTTSRKARVRDQAAHA